MKEDINIEWLSHGTYKDNSRLLACYLVAPKPDRDMGLVLESYVKRKGRLFARFRHESNTFSVQRGFGVDSKRVWMPSAASVEWPLNPLIGPRINGFELDKYLFKGIFNVRQVNRSSRCGGIRSRHGDTWYKLARNCYMAWDIVYGIVSAFNRRVDEWVTREGMTEALVKEMIRSYGEKRPNLATPELRAAALKTVMDQWSACVDLQPALDEGVLTDEDVTVELGPSKLLKGYAGYTIRCSYYDVVGSLDLLSGKADYSKIDDTDPKDMVKACPEPIGGNYVIVDGQRQIQLIKVKVHVLNPGMYEVYE